MDRLELKEILTEVQRGNIDVNTALYKIKGNNFEDIGFAKVDTSRQLRQGVGEVIYGKGKSPEQIANIAKTLISKGQQTVIATKIDRDKVADIKNIFDMEYYEVAQLGIFGSMPDTKVGNIVVATGGTSDIPVAEEASLTAEALGNRVTRIYDVGVAGIHRLLAYSDVLMSARVIVAIAGMEGALASVIGGLVSCPVIAVPTSVGYGTAFGGVTALLSMLNSCASGVSVVNIDNGFGAGYIASLINNIGEV